MAASDIESSMEIHSGGQTGVDRAALDVAIELGIPHGGWVPKGRLAEDGRIPDRYSRLRETTSRRYQVRTRRNVLDTDGTLLLTFGPAAGGTAYTREVAMRAGKPLLEIDLAAADLGSAAVTVRRWIEAQGITRLNVAGPRASQAPSAYDLAKGLLIAALAVG